MAKRVDAGTAGGGVVNGSAANARPLRVAVYSRYDRLGASSRMRFLQFAPLLAEHGISLSVQPLFDDDYLQTLYASGQRRLGKVLSAYRRRAAALHRQGAPDAAPDLAWIEKELFPYWPFALERHWWPAMPTVVDYDDAVFHTYDHSRHALVRRVLGRKIDRVMAAAHTVVCGNAYLADRAMAAGARRVSIVPTVVDATRYSSGTSHRSGPPVVGWIGSPATERYVLDLAPALRQACAGGRARVVLVGASPAAGQALADLPVAIEPWREDTEAGHIAGFDIGIMPLPDEPWERGKCGYKLVQYMACGVPVIASPVGANVEIVDPGLNGLLAATPGQWRDALQRLLADAPARAAMGRAGRQRVEQHYSLQVQGPRLAALLRAAAGAGAGAGA